MNSVEGGHKKACFHVALCERGSNLGYGNLAIQNLFFLPLLISVVGYISRNLINSFFPLQQSMLVKNANPTYIYV
jgi:hypothetical protein